LIFLLISSFFLSLAATLLALSLVPVSAPQAPSSSSSDVIGLLADEEPTKTSINNSNSSSIVQQSSANSSSSSSSSSVLRHSSLQRLELLGPFSENCGALTFSGLELPSLAQLSLRGFEDDFNIGPTLASATAALRFVDIAECPGLRIEVPMRPGEELAVPPPKGATAAAAAAAAASLSELPVLRSGVVTRNQSRKAQEAMEKARAAERLEKMPRRKVLPPNVEIELDRVPLVTMEDLVRLGCDPSYINIESELVLSDDESDDE